jgi:hypothetical protein
MTLSFEAVPPAAPSAYISEVTNSDDESDTLTCEPYEHFAAERKKRESKPSKLPEATPAPAPPRPLSSASR